MVSLSDDKQTDIIDAFNTTSRYMDNIVNVKNAYFDNMVSQIIYLSELQLIKDFQFYVLLSPYLCFISFYILIYMFYEMMHG